MRKSFSLFCWNIHSCVGRDGKCEPDRVRHALASVDFDVYCLQEVGWQLHRGTRDFDQFRHLAGEIKGHAYQSLTRTRGAHFGNFIISRYPLEATQTVKLGRRWGVPRCLQIADMVLPRKRITVMNTHLGLDPLERLQQMNRIADYVRNHPDQPRILCGDFNTLRNGLAIKDPARDDIRDCLEESESGFGRLSAVRHPATLAETPPHWARPSVPLGTHAPEWPREG